MDHILSRPRTLYLEAPNAQADRRVVSKLRAVGSPLRGVNGQSSGNRSFIHMFDGLNKAVNRRAAVRGHHVVTSSRGTWRSGFLDLRKNSATRTCRAHSLNTALRIPDEFFRRVEAGEKWYLFDPQYVPELTEVFGERFRRRTNAASGRGRRAHSGPRHAGL